jgi:hypothetical protein
MLTTFPQRRWPHARPPRGSPLRYEFMRCRHPTAITHSEKTALRSCFPLRTAPLRRIVRRTQREDSLSLNCDTRRQQGDPGELYYLSLPDRACLLLRLSCFFCGSEAADTRLSRCLESCFNAVKIRSLRFPKNWGFDESRICRFWLLAYSLILLCSSLVWLIELSFPRRVSAGVRAPLWGAGHWA